MNKANVEQPKKRLVLGKNWFHAIRRDPKIRENSSMPGTTLVERKEGFASYLYNPKTSGMCCVGIYLKEICGLTLNILAKKVIVCGSTFKNGLLEEAHWLIDETTRTYSNDAGLLYKGNDGHLGSFPKDLAPKEFAKVQRAIISEVFGRHNVEVVFED